MIDIHRRRLRWLPVVALACGIVIMSSIPGTQLPVPDLWNIDKLLHAFIYASLAGWLALPLHRNGIVRTRGALVAVCALAATAFGISDEWHQSFTPMRSPELWDVVADSVGAILGAMGYAWSQGRKAPQSQAR